MNDKSILLVEDNMKLANYLKESLQEAGYDTSIEKRGDRAVYRIIREQPSLVILDIPNQLQKSKFSEIGNCH